MAVVAYVFCSFAVSLASLPVPVVRILLCYIWIVSYTECSPAIQQQLVSRSYGVSIFREAIWSRRQTFLTRH